MLNTMRPTLILKAEVSALENTRAVRRSSSGLLLVDKPAGVSSHDVVARARRAANTKGVGHAGTLDPFATGLLVVAVGPATRLLPYLDSEPKVYQATFRFGFETDTEDSTGSEIGTAPLPDWTTLPSAIAKLTGSISQIPPAYSAKHVDGERAYKKARRGEEVSLAPVIITVHGWEVRAQHDDALDVVITCAGGTYVRSLARDLGRLMNSAAHCHSLRRVQSGKGSVAMAVSFASLERDAISDGTVELTSPLSALQEMTRVAINSDDEVHIRHGRSIAAAHDGSRAVLVDQFENIVSIANRTDDNRWQPRVVLPSSS
ncbi:MAG: tRNA pseudouridine(55) synthase TruB [Gemmatimonadaceae bacterium]